jgi:hypothetical protein
METFKGSDAFIDDDCEYPLIWGKRMTPIILRDVHLGSHHST